MPEPDPLCKRTAGVGVDKKGDKMSFQNVKKYFEEAGLGDRVLELGASSATVEEAARAIGCRERQIAKTMSFMVSDAPVLIVMAGDAKTDNKKFKETFRQKAKMIPADQVETWVGHAPGGVCPFAVKSSVTVYLDKSLKRMQRVYPAAGSGQSAVDLSLEELERYSDSVGWVDVCKGWTEEKGEAKTGKEAIPPADPAV